MFSDSEAPSLDRQTNREHIDYAGFDYARFPGPFREGRPGGTVMLLDIVNRQRLSIDPGGVERRRPQKWSL